MPYIYLSNGSAFADPSYTLRCFGPEIEPKTINERDILYHGTAYSSTFTAGGTAFVNTTVSEGWVGAPGVTQAFLSGEGTPNINRQDPTGTAYPAAYKQSELDALNQIGIGKLQSIGSPLSENADGYYNNGIYMQVTSADAPGTAAPANTPAFSLRSTFEDDLLTGFLAGGGSYYIQMPIWNWPGTAVTAGTVSFSSSLTYEPESTVSIPFNAGTAILMNDLSSAGDVIWKINRNMLTNGAVGPGTVDLSDVKAIKIDLSAPLAGTSYVFQTGQMKVVTSTYDHYKANVDTKRGYLAMERWPGTAQPDFPAIVQDGLYVKDFKYIAKLNSGTALPGTATPHEFSMFTRVHPDRVTYNNKYLQTKVQVDDTKVVLSFYEGSSLISSVTKETALTNDFFVIVDCKEDKYEAKVYSGEEHFIKNLVVETGKIAIADSWLNGTTDTAGFEAGFGFAGYEFKPSRGNFYLDYIYSQDVVLAEYESKIFESNLPVEAATIFPTAISDTELLFNGQDGFQKVLTTDNFRLGINEVGQLDTDVVVQQDNKIVYETQSIKVTKNENSYIASLEYSDILTIPNFSKCIFKTKLRFEEELMGGKFKVTFWDKKRRRIAFIQELTGLVPNKWNEIELPLISKILYSDELLFEFGHFGNVSQPASYWIEDPSLTIESVEWEVSNNGGKTYLPFLTAISDPYKSVNFPSDNFYSLLVKEEPVILQTFDDLIDIQYTQIGTNNTTVKLTNQYPFDTNPAFLKGSGTTVARFAYPVAMPQTIDTFQTGVKYDIPKCVNTLNRDYFVSLYDGGYIEIPSVNGFENPQISYFVWFYSNQDEENCNLGIHGDVTAPYTTPPVWLFDGLGTLYSSSGNPAIGLTIDGTTLEFDVPTWKSNGWHQAGFTYDNSSIKIYYDGELLGSSDSSSVGTLSTFTGPFKIVGPSYFGTTQTPDLSNAIKKLDVESSFTWLNAIVAYNKVINSETIRQHYQAAVTEYNQLRVRAKAYTKNAWIANYELVPKYASLGRVITSSPAALIFDAARFNISRFGV